jgi:hypothetical protein
VVEMETGARGSRVLDLKVVSHCGNSKQDNSQLNFIESKTHSGATQYRVLTLTAMSWQ